MYQQITQICSHVPTDSCLLPLSVITFKKKTISVWVLGRVLQQHFNLNKHFLWIYQTPSFQWNLNPLCTFECSHPSEAVTQPSALPLSELNLVFRHLIHNRMASLSIAAGPSCRKVKFASISSDTHTWAHFGRQLPCWPHSFQRINFYLDTSKTSTVDEM